MSNYYIDSNQDILTLARSPLPINKWFKHRSVTGDKLYLQGCTFDQKILLGHVLSSA